MKRSCAWQTHGLKKRKKTYTRNVDGNKTEIEFLLFGKNKSKYFKRRESTFLEIEK